MKAEYISLGKAAKKKKKIGLRRILEETIKSRIIQENYAGYTLLCDNQVAINFSKSLIKNA